VGATPTDGGVEAPGGPALEAATAEVSLSSSSCNKRRETTATSTATTVAVPMMQIPDFLELNLSLSRSAGDKRLEMILDRRDVADDQI
jgi:hypothetical protein